MRENEQLAHLNVVHAERVLQDRVVDGVWIGQCGSLLVVK